MADLLTLQEPLLEASAIRSVNFFNGRLLGARDLSRVEDARRTGDWRLGQAIGEGVAFGFDVARDAAAEGKITGTPSAVVSVSAGLAINRQGQALRLTCDTSVQLVRPAQAPVDAGTIFAACGTGGGGTYFAGAGLYVLTVAPAEADEGKAATNGLDPLNVRCNTDATVEGLQFRMLPVKDSLYAGLDPAGAAFRNRISYRCFGNAQRAAWIADPFADALDAYGLVDDMRGSIMTDCDVPLALIYMQGAATLLFIDCWAVRRRPGVDTAAASWPPFVSRRRVAEGEAMFLQFQDHVASLRASLGDLGGTTAKAAFAFLPPVGVIPVMRDMWGGDYRAKAFFTGLTIRGPAFINGAKVEALVRRSLAYPPIDLSSGEAIWLYRVRENDLAAPAAAADNHQRYIVFASGHMRYEGDGRYDLAYWDNGNYALDA